MGHSLLDKFVKPTNRYWRLPEGYCNKQIQAFCNAKQLHSPNGVHQVQVFRLGRESGSKIRGKDTGTGSRCGWYSLPSWRSRGSL